MFHKVPMLVLGVLAAQVPIALTDVTWDSPTAADVYLPGDTLQAVWTSPDKVVSPSFTICTGTADNSTGAGEDADCGTAVWPSVEQNGTEYSISLAIPNITGNGQYYLVMKDDAGTVYDTPNFALALTNDANSTANATATSSFTTSPPTSTSITYLPSHPAPTAAAIAVPLSLVAATLLGALFLLLFRARRSRQREKDKQKELRDAGKMGSRSRESNLSFASATDIERAVWTLAATGGYGGSAQYPHAPPQMNMGGPFGGPGLGAAAAAALGMGAFGWAHGFGSAAPAAPAMHDAYTPVPVPKYASSAASSGGQPHATYAATPPAPAAAPQAPRHEQEPTPRPVNWRETDWRGTDRMFTDEMSPSGAPQLPAIQIHASSPPLQVQHPPPPLPPKQLFPGSPHSPTPRAYAPPYASSPSPPAFASESYPPQTPGTDANASLNVISNYLQPSPALPQGQYLAPPNAHAPELPELRVPPASLTRARSLRRLETMPRPAENEKSLPVRPEDRVGMDLYGAVSRAVGR